MKSHFPFQLNFYLKSMLFSKVEILLSESLFVNFLDQIFCFHLHSYFPPNLSYFQHFLNIPNIYGNFNLIILISLFLNSQFLHRSLQIKRLFLIIQGPIKWNDYNYFKLNNYIYIYIFIYKLYFICF
jgi:hypothetical protein